MRLDRVDTGALDNQGGWLTTVLSRLCLDMLRARKSRREEALDEQVHEQAAGPGDHADHEVLLADAVGVAILVVLEQLSPAERVAFVLHDMFDLSFDEIAAIVDRSSASVR